MDHDEKEARWQRHLKQAYVEYEHFDRDCSDKLDTGLFRRTPPAPTVLFNPAQNIMGIQSPSPAAVDGKLKEKRKDGKKEKKKKKDKDEPQNVTYFKSRSAKEAEAAKKAKDEAKAEKDRLAAEKAKHEAEEAEASKNEEAEGENQGEQGGEPMGVP